MPRRTKSLQLQLLAAQARGWSREHTAAASFLSASSLLALGMPLKRWHFVKKDGAIYLYDSLQSDITKSTRIKLPKTRTKEDLGPVKTIETTSGKKEQVAEKYGPDNGLVVSISI